MKRNLRHVGRPRVLPRGRAIIVLEDPRSKVLSLRFVSPADPMLRGRRMAPGVKSHVQDGTVITQIDLSRTAGKALFAILNEKYGNRVLLPPRR